jgi:hypothetical protein
MILGELLHAATIAAYSPWFERQADAAVFCLRVVATCRGGTGFGVNVETKNTQDADSAASKIGSFAVSVPAVAGTYSTGVLKDMKELVRYAYSETGAADEWVHFQMMDPEWLWNETMGDPESLEVQ